MTAEYGKKWIGRHVVDCSGLLSWAFKQLGGKMAHGSNTMWNDYTTAKGDLKSGKRSDGKTLRPASAVFRRDGDDYYHVGLYVGNGKVIESQSTQSGVVISGISRWHAWGELKGVQYEQEVVPVSEVYQEVTVIADGGVNFRSAPNTSANRIAVIPSGAVVNAAAYNDTWSKVQYGGK